MSAAPNIEALQPLMRSILESDAYLIALSLGAEADAELTDEGLAAVVPERKSIVVQDDGLKDHMLELHLRTRGVCVVVEPMLKDENRDQSDDASIVDCSMMVKVMLNPFQNAREGSANANIYLMCKAVKTALIKAPKHKGGERFKYVESQLSHWDPGLWAYDLIFTKEAVA